MGNSDWGGGDLWGGEAQWQGDQWDNGGDWNTMPLRSCEAHFGRALAVLSPAPIATRNAFDPIAETSDSYPVPISDLVATNRRQPKKRTKKTTAEKKLCSTGCGCQDHDVREDWPMLEVDATVGWAPEAAAGPYPYSLV